MANTFILKIEQCGRGTVTAVRRRRIRRDDFSSVRKGFLTARGNGDAGNGGAGPSGDYVRGSPRGILVCPFLKMVKD